MSSIELRNGKIIGDYLKPYIIAEMNSSHMGDMEKAKEMIRAAKEAGCDCAKFQSWSTESLYCTSYYKENRMAKKLVKKFALTSEQLKELSEYCQEQGIDFSSTAYAKDEIDFLIDACNVPFVKISSMEINNEIYLEYVAKKNVPIILSTGMASYEEIGRAIKIITGAGNHQICVLHCVTKYPAESEIINLKNMVKIRDDYSSYPVGYSDHTLGCEIACASIALGAAVIEKHFTLDRNAIGMDNQMATEPEEMRQLVNACHNVYKALGTSARELSEGERRQKELMRRSVVATHTLEVGHIIQMEDLDAKRPGTGIPANEMRDLVGKKVIEEIPEDCLVLRTSIEEDRGKEID